MRAFIARHWPESARAGLATTEEIGTLLAGLDEALGEIPDGRGGVLVEGPVSRRKTLSLHVRFEAVKALEFRALAAAAVSAGDEAALDKDAAAVVLAILCTDLHRDLCALMTEALGYYALPMPDEGPGDNEAPLGGAYARSARKGMLAGLFASPGTLDAPRDRLARQLLEARNIGESGTGH